MEVEATNFWPCLLPLLKDIANAEFISIDVEMSGISTRNRNSPNDRSQEPRKPSLQEQYLETKAAAELYQVLQFGLTCVEEDHEHNMYVAKPYNFNLNPLFENERLDIHRDITFSTGAVQFLIKHGFDVGAVFTRGIRYLSHEEIDKVREQAVEKKNRAALIPDLIISPGDTEALNFYRNARQTIHDWSRKENKGMDFVNIGVPGGRLNGYQRRLVYQLVRTEFPRCRCFPKNNGDFMQVEKLDPIKEAMFEKQKLKALDQTLAKQTAFGHIFNALTTGDLSGLDPKWFDLRENGEPAFVNIKAKQDEIDAIEKTLKAKPRIIVGHNLFTDLIFVYKTFVGKLPDTVIEFKEKLHKLFPVVLDTKYMATQNQGTSAMRPASGLGELCEIMKNQTLPSICLTEKHGSYDGTVRDHEAGYDSWMTAQIFVKIASKLQAEQMHNVKHSATKDSESENKTSPVFAQAVQIQTALPAALNTKSAGSSISSTSSLNAAATPFAFKKPRLKPRSKRTKVPEPEYETTPETKTDEESILISGRDTITGRLIPRPRKLKQPKPKVAVVKGESSTKSRFSSANAFDMLGFLNDGDNGDPQTGTPGAEDAAQDKFKGDTAKVGMAELHGPFEGDKKAHRQIDNMVTAPSNNIFKNITNGNISLPTGAVMEKNLANGNHDFKDMNDKKQHNAAPHDNGPSQWIPDKDDTFWGLYTNLLRVYGTEQEMCDLAG